jgi:hypothetical protein
MSLMHSSGIALLQQTSRTESSILLQRKPLPTMTQVNANRSDQLKNCSVPEKCSLPTPSTTSLSKKTSYEYRTISFVRWITLYPNFSRSQPASSLPVHLQQ